MNDCAYNARSLACKNPFGAVEAKLPVRFTFYIPRNSVVSQARLIVEPDGGGEQIVTVADWLGISGSCDIYTCEYTPQKPGLYFYWFEASTAQGCLYVCHEAAGIGNIFYERKELFQLTVFDPSFKTPDWIKGGVIYQIFPDRFYREGSFLTENVPNDRTLLEDWGSLPPQGGGKYCGKCYFGGNFKGITKKLPYLKTLGVTTIYLNPIFESHSYHRYHTADFMKTDSLLGNTQDFSDLCKAAKDCGIRIILDGVFSHVGSDSIYFNLYGRYREQGAYQSKESKYYDWFDFKKWPDEYRSWWGVADLPEVKEENPSYSNFITGENGVAEHWLNCGASGWRLDVADELPDKFLENLRKRVKQCNPDNIIVGEVWEDASNKISYGNRRHYLEGEQLDSVMNYPWRNGIIEYLKKHEASYIEEAVMSILEHYPKQSVDVLMNMLGTHDTIRILTCLTGESSAWKDTAWKQYTHLSPDQRAQGLKLMHFAASIQFFLPGVPCIYYGDEAGMEGYEDPFNRQCYPWGNEDTNLLEWYRSLSAIRSACPAMKAGSYRSVAVHGGLYAFARTDEKGEDSIVCAVNLGDTHEKIYTGGRLCTSFGEASFDDGNMFLPPWSCAIAGIGDWVNNINK